MDEIRQYTDGNVMIRQTIEADAERLWELAFRDESPPWKQWDAPYYPHGALTYEQFVQQEKRYMIGNPARWVIETNGELIGMISYYWEHEESLWLEMGIVIFQPAYWNGGYGTRALKLWIAHLFRTMPLVRVGYTTWSGNERMIQVGYKLGMTMEARLRKCRLYQGVYYDSIRMGILREEWEQHLQAQRD
ncbi:GNAT family protein [Paenibacillus campi]|uniref:GNAT family N-acetyltransferase n=1 Tax=Paenibacillus campi TaxID=3106031 RepID=UPI002AFEA9B1|nr:GNAT family protein [Paenibacillus sp. SGZ-1009]